VDALFVLVVLILALVSFDFASSIWNPDSQAT
jgi:hypothetical protein